jgi:hypothetical protein
VKITGGGTTRERTVETVKETLERQRETVKTVIESLGVNKAQQAALHAYYDAITRAGMKTKSIRVGDRTFRIAPVMDIESGLERAEALAPLLKAGFKVEARQGNKVSLFRDLPEATRKELGEIRDQPGFVAAKSIAQTRREVAVTRFFKRVADNPEWASATETPGFVQMPSDKTRMGELAGKFLRSDIAAEINDAVRIKGDLEKIVNRVTNLWKIGKVSNPATIARNFMSSAIMADWGGLSFHKPSGIRSYSRAIAGFIGQDREAANLLSEAKQAGIFRAGYTQGEINALADGFTRSKEENPILRALDGLKDAVDKTGVTGAYGSVDTFYKGALYVHARKELGLSSTLASR